MNNHEQQATLVSTLK